MDDEHECEACSASFETEEELMEHNEEHHDGGDH